MKLPPLIQIIAKDLEKKRARAVVVGGAVRDFLLGKEQKDLDIEVYNIGSYDDLAKFLSKYGKVNIVGKHFGVAKLTTKDLEVDFSLPRLEKKIAKGHKGFLVETKSNLDFKEAAKRRDFTINAMGWDIVENKLLDPYNGKSDLENKILRVVDEKTFLEDPLRVYRAIQFAARFHLSIEPKTKELLKNMVQDGMLQELPKERIFEEIKKLLLKSSKPSIGFELMRELGILQYFPNLQKLIHTPQDEYYHSEGDVWIHTMMVLDEAAKLRFNDEEKDLILMFAALLHDIGKPQTTQKIEGRIRALRHEDIGEELSKECLERLTTYKKLIDEVAKLVKYHLRVRQLFEGKAKNAAIKKLRLKVDLILLERLSRADYFGRISKEKKKHFEAGDWFLQKIDELNLKDSAPKPFLSGKDLIALGLKPSPQFKKILDKVYELQLEEELKSKEEALLWVQKNFL